MSDFEDKPLSRFSVQDMFLLAICFLVAVYCGLFGSLVTGTYPGLAAVDFVTALLFLLTGLWILRRPGLKIQRVIVVGCATLFFLVLFIHGGPDQSSYIWGLVLPSSLMFLLGLKTGTWVSAGYLLLLVVVYFFSEDGKVPAAVFVRFCGAYIMLAVSAFAYEWSRAKHEKELSFEIIRRRHSEENLREREVSYRTLLDAIPDIVMRFDRECRHLFVSENVCEVVPFGSACFIGKTHRELGFPENLCQKWESVIRLVFKQGTSREIEFSLQVQGASRIFNYRFIPEYDETEEGVKAVLAIGRDVTENKQAEVELRHTHKLESIGQLAAGIAHEINTPAQFVNDSLIFMKEAFDSLSQLLPGYRAAVERLGACGEDGGTAERILQAEKDADLDYLLEHFPKSLSRATAGIIRIADIVQSMKEFAYVDKNGSEDWAPADINRMIETVIVVARHEYKYVADLEFAPGVLPEVFCRIDDISQVILNLVVNAAHAVADAVARDGGRGKIRIRTSCEGDFVRIDVEDFGAGVPAAIRDRIFEPFFTTKPVGKGTGQGLPISRSIVVKKHGGSLTFDSIEGQGAVFTVLLPIDRTNDRARKGE